MSYTYQVVGAFVMCKQVLKSGTHVCKRYARHRMANGEERRDVCGSHCNMLKREGWTEVLYR